MNNKIKMLTTFLAIICLVNTVTACCGKFEEAYIDYLYPFNEQNITIYNATLINSTGGGGNNTYYYNNTYYDNLTNSFNELFVNKITANSSDTVTISNLTRINKNLTVGQNIYMDTFHTYESVYVTSCMICHVDVNINKNNSIFGNNIFAGNDVYAGNNIISEKLKGSDQYLKINTSGELYTVTPEITVGSDYTNLTRLVGTVYTNNNDYPLYVVIRVGCLAAVGNLDCNIRLLNNNSVINQHFLSPMSVNQYYVHSFANIIPSNTNYTLVNNGTAQLLLYSWYENSILIS